MSFEPIKKRKSKFFSSQMSAYLCKEQQESETNKINIPCFSQLIVLIAVLDCLMSVSSHQMEMQGIIIPAL